MGKYSLEHYEKYKTIIIRPQPLSKNPPNFGNERTDYLTFSWNELEPSRGGYRLDGIKKSLNTASNPVLLLKPDLPVWVKDHADDYFSAFIRKVGSYIDGDRRLVGVVISTLADSKEEWNAYMDSFDALTILADLHHHRLIHHLREHGQEFGLLVKCSEDNWIACCEAFARLNLQDVWKSKPVILHLADQTAGPNIRREAMRWHACLSNIDMGLGYDLTLRRLTYPEAVSSNGSLPLRFWFVNAGSSRIYQDIELWLKLKQEHASYELPLNAATSSWLTGDIVHNEIVRLPDMLPGTYALSIGVFHKDRSCIHLNIHGEEKAGYYSAGTIKVEITDKDRLENIWDTYYPEGYYPLEDPKVPESEADSN